MTTPLPNTLKGVRDALAAGEGYPEDLSALDSDVNRIVNAYRKRIEAKQREERFQEEIREEFQIDPEADPDDPETQPQITSTRQLFGALGKAMGTAWKASRAESAVRDLRSQKEKAQEEWERLGLMLEADVPVRYQDLAWREVKRHLRKAGPVIGQFVK
ncbi:hypothetical protein ACQKM2_08955 [Streptomyces sp. NPDC004126]|uniref:hypothetical protein n=1 Tax=Streptomyces sp. NPDC004126 TaxID=3390695 RepID=UPI003D02D67A